MGLTTTDPFARLKALQRPSALPLSPQARRANPVADDRILESEAPRCGDWIAESLGAQVNRNEFGEYLTITRWFADPSENEGETAALRLLWPDAPETAVDRHQWLFLDTETTGLAGGTGTYPFLVGTASWNASGIQIEQFFMRDLNEEWAVLYQVLGSPRSTR